jgi:hypothetical protein
MLYKFYSGNDFPALNKDVILNVERGSYRASMLGLISIHGIQNKAVQGK